MKFILMMSAPRAGFESYRTWSEADVQQHMNVIRQISRDLTESGEFVMTEGLGWPGDAVSVRAGASGQPVTDGVFPEGKEFLAGFWIVDVENPERACEIAARISAAPGPGGIPTAMPIEVRQIMRASHGDCV